MKKNNILLVFVFCAIQLFSQTREADLVFKDGDTIPGFGMITNDKTIKFKLSLEEEADIYEGILVKEIIFYGDKDFKIFEFVKTGVKRKPVLMETIISGKTNLYELRENYKDLFDTKEETKANLSNSRHVYVDNVDKALYLKRKDEPVGLRISKSFKQTAVHYFRDCKEIKELFESREYLNLTKKQIIEEYNLLCND